MTIEELIKPENLNGLILVEDPIHEVDARLSESGYKIETRLDRAEEKISDPSLDVLIFSKKFEIKKTNDSDLLVINLKSIEPSYVEQTIRTAHAYNLLNKILPGIEADVKRFDTEGKMRVMFNNLEKYLKNMAQKQEFSRKKFDKKCIILYDILLTDKNTFMNQDTFSKYHGALSAAYYIITGDDIGTLFNKKYRNQRCFEYKRNDKGLLDTAKGKSLPNVAIEDRGSRSLFAVVFETDKGYRVTYMYHSKLNYISDNKGDDIDLCNTYRVHLFPGKSWSLADAVKSVPKNMNIVTLTHSHNAAITDFNPNDILDYAKEQYAKTRKRSKEKTNLINCN